MLAVSFDLPSLARLTSGIILVVFALVSFGLWRLRASGAPAPRGALQYPRIVPLLAGVACLSILAFQIGRAMS
jgi:hypothetical protein